MTDASEKITSGDGSDTPVDSSEQQAIQQQQARDKVAYTTYQKVLGEKKRTAEENANLKEQLTQFMQEKESRETKELEDQKQYHQLLENERQKTQTLQSEVEALRENFTYAKKVSAFYDVLGGAMDDSYLPLVPLDEVIVDPTTGDIDEMSVTNVVDKFRAKHGRLIDNAEKPKTGLPIESPKGVASDFSKMSNEQKLEMASKLISERMG